MMACYEKYFGSYPFWRDGYKLVETPYWGMEHQSAIAYGNDYVNNRAGFDYIIIHESAHEWWGNNVSANDYADLWIHESFATYAEALYVECTKSRDDAIEYLKGLRWEIRDSFPIAGVRGVNYDGSKIDNDMYYKGAWMLHTFRSVLNNDTLFFSIIKGLQSEFALKTISTDDVIAYINRMSGKDYTAFFRQYLYHTMPPILEYKTKQKGKNTQLTFRWKADEKDFSMPVEVTSYFKYEFGNAAKEFMRINATDDWQTITITNFNAHDFNVNTDKFYVKKELVK
jgi:aminopeptidase N